jgi:hypothetical protein
MIKKFLIRLLIFTLPIILFFLVFENGLSRIKNSYNLKREYLENQLDSIEVLVFGSSQSLYGINPEYFCLKGFNLSNLTQSLWYDKRLCLKYIDRMPRLKIVILSISYFSLDEYLIDTNESWRDYYYAEFWGLKFPDMDRLDSKLYSRFFLYTPDSSINYALHSFKVNLATNLHRNGWERTDTLENYKNISDSLGQIRVSFHNEDFDNNRFQSIRNDLDSFLEILVKRGIQPIFITTPVCSTYSKFVKPEIMKRNKGVIESFCEKYHCRYFDYFQDRRFTMRDFLDNDHLNFIGSAKFSKIINTEILKPLTTNYTNGHE